MELLRSLGIDWRLLFWQVVNFAVVLMVLRRYVFSPLFKILDQRARKIESGLKEAEMAGRVRQDAEKERARVLGEAREEAGLLLVETRKEAESLKARMFADTRAEISRLMAQGKEALALERAAMIKEAKRELAELVIDAAKAVTPRVLKEEDHQMLLEEARQAIGRARTLT